MEFQMSMVRILILLTTVFCLQHNALAHVEHPKDTGEIGLKEKLGQYVPLDLTFNDEEGHPVTLRQLIHTPTILALVYFHCPNVCSLLLQNLADVLTDCRQNPEKSTPLWRSVLMRQRRPALPFREKKVYLQMITDPFRRMPGGF